MLGAIIGDVVGAPYEDSFDKPSYDFPLFQVTPRITDDSVLTIAVTEAFLFGTPDDETVEANLVASIRKWARKYPNSGYGSRFVQWLISPIPRPYGSFGNGSAMRVSAVGWLFNSLAETEHWAEISARVTYDHPEGIKGAQAVAAAIFMARNASTKAEIQDYITVRYGYDLTSPIEEIRPTYAHDITCQGSVPQSIRAFLDSTDFESAIRNAVWLGGDTDTMAKYRRGCLWNT